MPASLANASGEQPELASIKALVCSQSCSADGSRGEKASLTPAEAPVTSPENGHGTTRRSGQPSRTRREHNGGR